MESFIITVKAQYIKIRSLEKKSPLPLSKPLLTYATFVPLYFY